MFVAAYWWDVYPGKEDQFRTAWRRGTELIRAIYGSHGSRLHRDRRPGRPIDNAHDRLIADFVSYAILTAALRRRRPEPAALLRARDRRRAGLPAA